MFMGRVHDNGSLTPEQSVTENTACISLFCAFAEGSGRQEGGGKCTWCETMTHRHKRTHIQLPVSCMGVCMHEVMEAVSRCLSVCLNEDFLSFNRPAERPPLSRTSCHQDARTYSAKFPGFVWCLIES